MNTEQDPQEYQPYFNVLKKYINFLLFGSVVKPKFLDQKFLINPTLLKMLKDAKMENDHDKRDELVKKFSENFYMKFKARLRYKDKLDLVLCYINSNVKTFIQARNFLKITGEKNQKFQFGDELKILEDLFSDGQFPIEIISYMYIQFSDILGDIPENCSVISLENYEVLLQKYVTKYDIDKTIDIIYEGK